MRRHVIEVNERELRSILTAFDIARDQTVSESWGWFTRTKYVDDLYLRLRGHGLELTGQALGYISTPLAFSEAFTAMQTGIVNGVLGSGAEGYYSSFRDLTKFYLPVNSHFEMWFLYVSEASWKKLSDNHHLS